MNPANGIAQCRAVSRWVCCLWMVLAWVPELFAAEGRPKSKTPPLRSFLEANGYTSVALRKSERGYLLTPARLNGKKVLATIDTGFTYSAVDQSLAGRLPPLDPNESTLDLPRAALALTNTQWIRVGHLDLGGYRTQNQPAQSVSVRTDEPPGALARLFEGEGFFDSDLVLGADFLRRHHAIIEYQSTPVLYLRPDRAPSGMTNGFEETLVRSGYRAIRLYQIETLGWVLPARFDGNRISLLLDTGANETIVDLGFVRQFGIPVRDAQAQLKGVEGRESSLKIAQLSSIQLGDFTIANPPVLAADLSQWHLSRTNRSVFQPRGLIGGRFFNFTAAIIDCDGQKLWCRSGR